MVAAVGAVVAEGDGALGKGVVIGDKGTAFADGAEVLGGVKAEGADGGEVADLGAANGGAVGLRGVLDDTDAVPEDGVHVAGMTVEVDGDDGFGFRSDGGGEPGGVEEEGGEVQGGGAAIDGDDVAAAVPGGEFFLEGVNFRPEAECAGGEGLVDGGAEFVAQDLVLFGQAEVGDFGAHGSGASYANAAA